MACIRGGQLDAIVIIIGVKEIHIFTVAQVVLLLLLHIMLVVYACCYMVETTALSPCTIFLPGDVMNAHVQIMCVCTAIFFLCTIYIYFHDFLLLCSITKQVTTFTTEWPLFTFGGDEEVARSGIYL